MVVDATPSVCALGVLDSLNCDAVEEITETWNGFCFATEALLNGDGDLSFGSEFVSQAHTLCKHSLESLVEEHFLGSLEETFERNGALKFWQHFDAYKNVADLEMNMDHNQKDRVQKVLCKALEEISLEKQYQEKCLLMLINALLSYKDIMVNKRLNSDTERHYLFSKYRSMVSSVLMATLPRHFPGTTDFLVIFSYSLRMVSVGVKSFTFHVAPLLGNASVLQSQLCIVLSFSPARRNIHNVEITSNHHLTPLWGDAHPPCIVILIDS
ncbi:hypothetical protein U1Q18_016847 [Sarracenia purpurea var. burkii]